MLIPLLAFLQASPVTDAATTLRLYRGASVYGAGASPSYQDVEDTVLDKSAPDSVHGGDYTLLGGTGHTLLLRFGDLPNAIGRKARVLDATLILTSTSSDKTSLQSIGVVTRSWGEGPFKTLGNVLKPGAEILKIDLDAFAATWKSRMDGVGGSAWQTPGAIGADVTPIPGAQTTSTANRLEITGLGAAVNAMLMDPGSNFGFALSFSTDSEFFSSESSIGKPELLLTLGPSGDSSPGDVALESISPAEGGYVAHIRNLGSEPVTGLKASWSVDAEAGPTVDVPGTLAPNQTQEIKFDGGVRTNGLDHRYGALTLRISPSANDRQLADKQLTLYTAGLPITVVASHETMLALENAHSARGRGAANWLQSQIDFVNDVVLARSRYSFATGGCRERVRLDHVQEGSAVGGTSGFAVELRAAASYPRLDFDFIRQLLIAIGAPNLGLADLPLGSNGVKIAGWNVGGIGPAPDLTGGGDTRYDGGLARQSLLPEIPVFDPVLSAPGLESTGLLSGSGVGMLDALVSTSIANRAAALRTASGVMPHTVLLAAYDASNSPLKNVDLAFFQSQGGVIADHPAFTISTGETGTALLPHRAVSGTQLTNAFASRDIAADGAFLVRATGPAGVGWGWLKAWQLTDAAYRGDADFASVPISIFMVAGSVDTTVNRALNRAVTDSAGSLPAKLSPLVDGQAQTPVALPQKVGDWIELDLNRDWTIAELRLTTLGGAPWKQFAIKVYQTGQKPDNAIDWFSEANWDWSVQNRGTVDTTGRQRVTYDGPAVQIRFIRIVCIQPGAGGLAQIEAFSTRAGS